MYSPLIKALKFALGQLSKMKVLGLPEFKEERQIVFARSDARCIESESYLQGLYKPDIVLVHWEAFKSVQDGCLPEFLRIGYLLQIRSRPA